MGLARVHAQQQSNSNMLGSSTGRSSASTKSLLESIRNRPSLAQMLNADAGTSASGDVLDLSAAGLAASQSTMTSSWIDSLYAKQRSATQQSTVQSTIDEAGGYVQQKLKRLFAESGVAMSKDVGFRLDASGKLVVVGDAAQKKAVEEAMKKKPEIQRAVNEYLSFMEAIAPALREAKKNPAGIDAKVTQLLAALGARGKDNDPQGVVTLTVKGDRFETRYDRTNASGKTETSLLSSTPQTVSQRPSSATSPQSQATNGTYVPRRTWGRNR